MCRRCPAIQKAGATINRSASSGFDASRTRLFKSCFLYWRSFYGDLIPGHVLAERLATFIHVFTLYWYVR